MGVVWLSIISIMSAILLLGTRATSPSVQAFTKDFVELSEYSYSQESSEYYPRSSDSSPGPPLSCNRAIEGNSGRFTSPDYPAKSTQFLQCRVTITTSPRFVPVVVFHEFEFVGSGDCYTEIAYVQVNAIRGHPDRICGSHKPFSVTADSNVAVIDMVGSVDGFNWFSASFYSINVVNAHRTVFENVIGRFDSTDLHHLTESESYGLILVHAEPGSQIYVSFEEVLASTNRPVRIVDQVTEHVIAELRGRHYDFSVKSEGNELLIEYYWDVNAVLEFEYQVLVAGGQDFPECNVALTKETGSVLSPGYPIAYPPNLDCEITIRADPDQYIRLVFLNFSVNSNIARFGENTRINMNEECNDYLQITEVTTDSTERVCGDLAPFAKTSESNELMLIFHTDDHDTAHGFNAEYTFISADRFTRCIFLEAPNELDLQTPSGDDITACTRLITTDPGAIITLKIHRFNFPAFEVDDCDRQGIKIVDVVTQRSEVFCGLLPVFRWTSDSNEVEVSVPSVPFNNEMAFGMTFIEYNLPRTLHHHQECRHTITDRRCELSIPPVPLLPLRGMTNCFILFHTVPGHRFQLTIQHLVIDAHPASLTNGEGTVETSGSAHLKIQDVSVIGDSAAKFIELTTGQPDFTWTSETNEVIVETDQGLAEMATVNFRVEYYTEAQVTVGSVRDLRCGYVVDSFPGTFELTTPPNHCKLVFRANPFNRVLINILFAGDSEESTNVVDDCGEVYIEFQDILTHTTERVCALYPAIGFSWLSEGNELSILVHGDNLDIPMTVTYSTIARPIDAHYRSFLLEPSGEFSSLVHSSDDRALGICQITLHAGFNQRINLQFLQFAIGEILSTRDVIKQDESCADEYIQVQDRTTGRTNRYCGLMDLFSWTSDANVVQVSFKAMSNVVYRGFRTVYRFLPRIDGEFVTIVGDPSQASFLEPQNATGFFTSQYFPEYYPANSRLELILHADPGSTIVLLPTVFDLDFREDCSGDSLEFTDLGSDIFLRTCGYHVPFAWSSDTNEVKMTFTSDMQDEGRGFFLGYLAMSSIERCVRLISLNTSQQHITIRTDDVTAALIDDGVVAHHVSCLFVIQATPEFRVRLNVADLLPSGFVTGSIKIFDVVSSRLFEYELSDPRPWAFTSEGNLLHLFLRAYQDVLPSLTISTHTVHQGNPPDCQVLIDNPSPSQTMFYTGFQDIDELVLQNVSSDPVTESRLFDSDATRTGSVPISGLPTEHDCHMIIRLDPALRLTVTISMMEATGYDCTEHASEATLVIEDSTSMRQNRYCGPQPPFTWTSDGNDVLIEFKRNTLPQTLQVMVNFKPFERPSTKDVSCSKVLTDYDLVLESVKFPGMYPENLNCQTVLLAPPNQRIQMIFTEFHIEGIAGGVCERDFVEITDLTTGLRDRACGELRHYSYTSDANEILLRFVTDSCGSQQGYQASYTFQDRPKCGRTHHEERGDVEYVYSETVAESIVICTTLIHAPPPLIIRIEIDHFQLIADPDCEIEYFEINDIAVQETERFCGSRENLSFISQGNEVEITYYSSENGNGTGYSGMFKQMEPDVTSDCEDQTFETSPQMFTSPRFSAGLSKSTYYANNLDCTYTFLADDLEVIELAFLTFDLEESDECQYDYIEVQTLWLGSAQRYCGVLPDFVWMSRGRTATLRFHSDHILTGRGFEAEYRAVPVEAEEGCALSFESAFGSFTSQRYPDDYPNNQDCKYYITVEPGYVVRISFTHFQVEYHRLCDYDYVQIFNEPAGPSSPRYCGLLDPFTFDSETNQILVEFHSDTSVRSRGFIANFSSVPSRESQTPQPVQVPLCQDTTYQDDNGVFTSPNFPYKYDNDDHCRIDIRVDDVTARIRVTFHLFDVEEHHECEWDFVQLTDTVTHRQSDRLCGSFTKPYMWVSDSNAVIVVFRSDDLVTRTGFYATYEMVPGNAVGVPRPASPP